MFGFLNSNGTIPSFHKWNTFASGICQFALLFSLVVFYAVPFTSFVFLVAKNTIITQTRVMSPAYSFGSAEPHSSTRTH